MRSALLTLAIILCFGNPLPASDWGPWEAPPQQPKQSSADTNSLQLAVRWFQKYISPVDGPRCRMYPTCSAYSLQALHKHGTVTGVFLTVDRLYREGDPHEHARPIEKWGRMHFYDPLGANDFWLER